MKIKAQHQGLAIETCEAEVCRVGSAVDGITVLFNSVQPGHDLINQKVPKSCQFSNI